MCNRLYEERFRALLIIVSLFVAACAASPAGDDQAAEQKQTQNGRRGCFDVTPLLMPSGYPCRPARGIDVLHTMLSLGEESSEFAIRTGYARGGSVNQLINRNFLEPIAETTLKDNIALQSCLSRVFLLPIPMEVRSAPRIAHSKINKNLNHYISVADVDSIRALFPSSAFYEFTNIVSPRHVMSKHALAHWIGAEPSTITAWHPPQNFKIKAAEYVQKLAWLLLLRRSVARFIASTVASKTQPSAAPPVDKSTRVSVAFVAIIDFFLRTRDTGLTELDIRQFGERWSKRGLVLTDYDFRYGSKEVSQYRSWEGWPGDLVKRSQATWKRSLQQQKATVNILHEDTLRAIGMSRRQR